MIRFKIRTSVKAILSALRSDTFMVDVAVVSGHNKVPVVLQHLFTGLGGNQVLDCTLTATSIKKSNKPSASQQTLQDGFLFIKDNGPRSNNQNQMTEWCEMQIVEGSGSVIEGWSRDLVMSSLKNYASGSMASTSLMEYPVTLRDVRRWVLDEVVVPFLKVAPEHRLILQGQTGIGKTPLARALAMSISQHYISEEGLEAEPSIRSCAVLDMLRTEGGQKHKPIVYDDGPLDTNKASDVKGLMDVQEEEVLLWAQWGSIKLVKAQHRCIITNPLGDKPDAGALERTISHEAFQQLVSPAFVMGMPEQDFLAILKRAFHVVFLKDRCYIRHPCESKAPVKQYMYPWGIADLIKDESKSTLGAYKRGEQPDQPRLDANRRWSEVLVRKGIAGENLEEFIDANADIAVEPPSVALDAVDDSRKEADAQPKAAPVTSVKVERGDDNVQPPAKRTRASGSAWGHALRPSQSAHAVIDIEEEEVQDEFIAKDVVAEQMLEAVIMDLDDPEANMHFPSDSD